MMDRRSFLATLASAGVVAIEQFALDEETWPEEDVAASAWDALGREEKMSLLAERVVPGADLEALVTSPADLEAFEPGYEQYQSEAAGTPFVDWLDESDVSVTSTDVAVRAYARPESHEVDSGHPRYIDGAVIAIPPGETDSLVTAVKRWEHDARTQGTVVDNSHGVVLHNGGISRYLTFTEPSGYRIQRIRIFGDRMLVHWLEGMSENEKPHPPLSVVQQLEQEILLRRVRSSHTDENSIPDERSNNQTNGL